ncbi:hypothetical protein N8697_00555 [bacterium]|nr:hypothetical protein [bacterium]
MLYQLSYPAIPRKREAHPTHRPTLPQALSGLTHGYAKHLVGNPGEGINHYHGPKRKTRNTRATGRSPEGPHPLHCTDSALRLHIKRPHAYRPIPHLDPALRARLQ